MYQLSYLKQDPSNPFKSLRFKIEAEDYKEKELALKKVKELKEHPSISSIFLVDTSANEFVVMDGKEF